MSAWDARQGRKGRAGRGGRGQHGRGRDGRDRGHGNPELALTRRGIAQLIAAATLLAAGAVGGWEAPAVAGGTLAAAAMVGLVEVLLARALWADGSALTRLLPEPDRSEERWVRLDQHGRVIARADGPADGRGLYRLRSVTPTWHDAFGFWWARRTLPSDREVCVPPSANASQVRRVAASLSRRAPRQRQELDAASGRPYERGDALRQISWRQSAHHGELMSFEREAAGAPPLLVTVDALGAANADALAETASALLAALRDAPDVLVTDGVSSWRTPAQQERFLAALLAEPLAGPPAAATRARTVRRLANAGGRPREVLLVTYDARAGLGPDLLRGAGSHPPTVIAARAGGGLTRQRELVADAPEDGEKDLAPATQARQTPGTLWHELLAGVLCCALALLVMVPLTDVIFNDPWWEAVAAALLAAGSSAGSAVGSLLRARRPRRGVRALAAVLLALAVLASGVACVLGAHAERGGAAGPVAASQGPAGAAASAVVEAPGRLADVVATGTAQLGGAPWEGDEARWDLAIALAGAGLGATAALLASSRQLRCAMALLPLGVAAADQAVMGTELPAWCAVVCALGLLLAWLASPRTRRAGRSLTVVLLAVGLGAGASGAVTTLGLRPVTDPVGTGAGPAAVYDAPAGTGVSTLVDLSRDLQSNSSEVALTYVTTAGQPLYLRLGVLNDFTGDTWEFSELGSAAVDATAPLEASAAAPLELTRSAPVVTTTVLGGGASAPVPPGTATTELDGADLVARGRYFAPVASATDLARLTALLANLRDAGFAATSDASGPTELERSVPAELPASVRELITAARADGVGGDALDAQGQIAVVGWLVGYFTSGDFSYALDAPGGDGLDNLSVIGELLTERRGYCTHYATAFALLARALGVPARVALGYLPAAFTDETGAYVVTMRQLHAWAEVWVDGIGWVGVDVTPLSADGAGVGADLGSAVVQTGEPETPADEAPATDPGVTTTEEVETPVVPETPESDPAASNDPSAPPGENNADAADSPAAPDGVPAWFAPALAGAVAALVATAAAVLPRARRRRRLARGDTELAWRELCRIARRRGLSWEPSATEDQIADLIAAALPDGQLATSVHRVARAACLARYGAAGSAPAAGKPADLSALLASVSRALAQKGRPGGTKPPGCPRRTG